MLISVSRARNEQSPLAQRSIKIVVVGVGVVVLLCCCVVVLLCCCGVVVLLCCCLFVGLFVVLFVCVFVCAFCSQSGFPNCASAEFGNPLCCRTLTAKLRVVCGLDLTLHKPQATIHYMFCLQRVM